MKLTEEQIHRILREIEQLDYGRVIVTVCGPKRHVTLMVERQVRIDEAQTTALDTAAKGR